MTPKLKLDHVIKERYPTFVDALRDLDDALSMLFLFANLPSHAHIPAKTVALCQRLTLEFQHYIIVSNSLRKSFLSIKGIYYQATIQGQDILWLVPYKFVQRVTGDIDFRIMGTFIEFYTTLLGFVNFRLYTSLGLVYPPKFNAGSDDRGAELGAFTLEGKTIATKALPHTDASSNGQEVVKTSAAAQAAADKVAELQGTEVETKEKEVAKVHEDENKIDTFEPTADDADTLPQPSAENSEIATLFAPFTFYLSRESPRQSLEFLLKAFGCKRVGWDGTLGDGAFTTDENDPNITHQIVDRPALASTSTGKPKDVPENGTQRAAWPRATVPGRTYVQPQWVWDCINQCKLLRPDLYAPGVTLPPHLSPWVKAKRGQYDPTITLEEQEREGEAEEHEDDLEDEDEEEDDEIDGGAVKATDLLLDRADDMEVGEGMDVAGSSDEDEEDEEDEEDIDEDEDEDDAEEDEEDEEEAARVQHQRELEAEAAGLAPESVRVAAPLSNAELARKKRARKQKADQEELDRQMMMMSRKKRKLMDKMVYSNKKKDEEAEKLRAKRRRLEKTKKAAA